MKGAVGMLTPGLDPANGINNNVRCGGTEALHNFQSNAAHT